MPTTGDVIDTYAQSFEAELANVGLRGAAPYTISHDEHHLYIDVTG